MNFNCNSGSVQVDTLGIYCYLIIELSLYVILTYRSGTSKQLIWLWVITKRRNNEENVLSGYGCNSNSCYKWL